MADNIFDIEVEGLEPVLRKFENAPKTLARGMNDAMKRSMDVIQSEMPGYPPKRENQKVPYTRTGTLARSLGKNMAGGNVGKPSIYSVAGSGQNMMGQVGTNLIYAKYVVGDPDAAQGEGQAYMHKNWWWTLDFVARKAKEKVQAVWDGLIKELLDV